MDSAASDRIGAHEELTSRRELDVSLQSIANQLVEWCNQGKNFPDQFAAQFTFEVTRNDTGKNVTLEEVAVYTVRGDKIAREQFFYDGEH